MFLLAQLVEPPIQPGPVRLPNRPVQERRRQDQPQPTPLLQPDAPIPEATTAPQLDDGEPLRWRPPVQGKTPYSEAELRVILSSCGQTTVATTLNACASALTARLIKDGYINSRVFTNADPAPGALDVVLGTIAELRIDSEDTGLKDNVQQQLQPLIGTVLHLPTLEAALVQVRRNGVGSIKGSMGRLGSDPTKAVISLNVEQAPPTPLQGEVELSNTGNTGSGEWRGIATVLQNNLLRQGDTGLLFLELDTDGQLELGTAVLSGTYTWPLSPRWSLTGSLGSSYRRFVEFQKPAYNFSFRTLQGLVQLETVLHQTPSFVWDATAGISANRNNSYESGRRPSVPLVAGGAHFRETHNNWDSWTRSGYLKLGTRVSGISGNAFWSSNLFFLQGLAGFTPDKHLNNLDRLGIEPGTARALGGQADLSWRL